MRAWREGSLDFSQSDRYDRRWLQKEYLVLRSIRAEMELEESRTLLLTQASMFPSPNLDAGEMLKLCQARRQTYIESLWPDALRVRNQQTLSLTQEWEKYMGIKIGSKEFYELIDKATKGTG